jgi:hypothetical protein
MQPSEYRVCIEIRRIAMIIASRIPELTDRMLAATLHAAEASSTGADWMALAEIEHLERRLQERLAPLGYRIVVERRAA